jgi:hypothetical protein
VSAERDGRKCIKWSYFIRRYGPPISSQHSRLYGRVGWRTQLRLGYSLNWKATDCSKSAVLNSLRSPESKRGYRHAIDDCIQWYCSEPHLSFNKTVVIRYRRCLEDRHLAPGITNGRLAAVRRLAYEASDAGLLNPESAAGLDV